MSERETCAECEGRRWLRDAATAKFRECACLVALRRRRAAVAAGIPREAWEATLPEGDPRPGPTAARELRDALVAFLHGERAATPPALLACGGRESARIALAGALLVACLDAGGSARFVRMTRVIRQAFRDDEEAGEEPVPLRTPAALIVALGGEVQHRTKGALLLDLYWERRARGLWTGVLFPGPAARLEAEYGAEAARTLRDPAHVLLLALDA